MIVVIDYGIGNLGSILNMLRKIGAEATISSHVLDIKKADKLILPGVGAFDTAMKNIEEYGLLPVLDKKVIRDGTPLLGICLGMQLLTKKSEEGVLPGIGWIEADTAKFKFENTQEKLKVPHMGWNTVQIAQNCPLFDDMYEEPRFYFVHSYHVICRNKSDILANTSYGYDFISSIVRDNIAGVQFHPEKSHKFGIKLLRNFAEKF